ncbi:MAG: GGDEF domain-containing protein [bacterium]|nr:GGDEF domain-containing protein [bacterium]
MNNRERKVDNTTQVYKREFQLVERLKGIFTGDLSNQLLLKEYKYLIYKYEKLLKQTLKITRVGDSNQRKLLAAYEEIEDQKEQLSIAYKKLELVAREDPLTQLSNRRYFLERFEDEINRFERHRQPFSLVLGDIDNFKPVNDRYGHNCGDIVLVGVAKIMTRAVRKIDTVARWGGEEFILLLPQTPLVGGKKVAEEIRKRTEAKIFTYYQHRLSITMTCGVSQFNGNCDIETCVKKADEALYRGKQEGKNRVILYEEDNKEDL